MIAVIFEVQPDSSRQDDYLAQAAALEPQLETLDGFISIERFASLSEPGKILSLSIWKDEGAVRQWRNNPQHRAAQSAGRDGIFLGYRLRVATVVRDYGFHDRRQVPQDSLRAHD